MHYFTISTRPRSTLLPSKNRSKGLEIGVICDDLRVGSSRKVGGGMEQILSLALEGRGLVSFVSFLVDEGR